ncbi:helix-turn-helix domain-containing protein [Streptomyces paromomycinus]|uniref:HTH cro/C1-type domain-containing protein n=1 Tax=Streptomyces paromomycinus TaxID=92743 RepID=A0A401WA42_STREY|nr:helix-turn-helix transcriptional regulator [Streptomyces paromomycinus]GCD46160.1 hypothetical protein GKJPGBOP_05907 [Streptomyces paromomycinus]
MSTEERPETLADLIKRLKDEYDVKETQIARRIGVAPATVNAWVNGTRGTGRGPNPDKLRRLAEEFPRFTEREIFAAAGRKVPGPVDDDAEARILALYRSLTAEQQEMKEIEMRALAERNQLGSS